MSVSSDKKIARELYLSGLTIHEVSEKIGLGAYTIYKWCKDIIRKSENRQKPRHKYEISGQEVVIIVKRKSGEIVRAKIDLDDYEKFKTFPYSFYVQNYSGSYYIYSNHYVNGKRKHISLHRLILGDPKGLVVDHINGDTLDNRKSNLRAVTQAANTQNRNRAKRNSSSGVRGVYFSKQIKRWVATVDVDRKRIQVGCFKELADAEIAVKEARARYMPFSPEWRERHHHE